MGNIFSDSDLLGLAEREHHKAEREAVLPSFTKIEDPAEKDLVDDELINHPNHYNNGRIECIDYIEDQGLNYHAGCAVKYLARYRFKGTPARDLRKAAWYCLRLADKIEKEGL